MDGDCYAGLEDLALEAEMERKSYRAILIGDGGERLTTRLCDTKDEAVKLAFETSEKYKGQFKKAVIKEVTWYEDYN